MKISIMNYFAKYLPVEGEITPEDRAYFPSKWKVVIANPNMGELCKIANKYSNKKAKLFLCSRDIQVGDEYYTNDLKKYKTPLETDEDYFKYNNERFKVIGEISSDAVFVKDGDELEYDQLLADGVGKNWDRNNTNLKFKVKCPCCNKFV